jgi:hypothetical protein
MLMVHMRMIMLENGYHYSNLYKAASMTIWNLASCALQLIIKRSKCSVVEQASQQRNDRHNSLRSGEYSPDLHNGLPSSFA